MKDRNEKGRFIKGHTSIKYWLGKKRPSTSKETKEKISISNKGKIRTIIMKEHYRQSRLGSKNPMYKNGKFKVKSGHILVLKPKHPFANVNGRVFEHRLIVEEYLGRYLKPFEQVHHIDGDSSNNVIDNLFLTTKKGNSIAHHSLNKLIKSLLEDKIIRFNKNTGLYERN